VTLRHSRRSPWIAVLLVLAFLPGLRHVDSGDPCAPVVDSHDAANHAMSAAVDAATEHCAICHASRLPGRPIAPPSVAIAPPAANDHVAFNAHPLRAPAEDRLPARAPPVTPLA
jgi:hypothetical protein